MKSLLTRVWHWRLRTAKDYALFTASLVALGLLNLVVLGQFDATHVVTTVLGVLTGAWIGSKLLSPKDGPPTGRR